VVAKFLHFVEIRTKITSTFAFLYTIAYLFYCGQQIRWQATLVFFAAMFLFDLTTTAINNYIDSKDGFPELPFKRNTALAIIMIMLGVSAALGLYLVWLTDLVVLLLGGLCFLCGILYTGGPVPISRQPLGEILSGLFYGFFIPFLLLYVNMPTGTYLTLDLSWKTVSLFLQIYPLITVALLSVIPICVTANIMLANNICDLERDITVKRHTLPYYIGKGTAVRLLALIYYMTYAALIMMVVLKILPVVCLVALLSLIPVQKNIKIFKREQIKEKTFVISVKNYILIMGTNTILIFLGGMVN
jgi:1,4-dihydroxy-2-naphthoate octaprenyltransferase